MIERDMPKKTSSLLLEDGFEVVDRKGAHTLLIKRNTMLVLPDIDEDLPLHLVLDIYRKSGLF